MNLKELLNGIEIIRKYYNNPDGYKLNAEHDQINLDSTDRKIPDEDIKRLIELGWRQEYEERGYGTDFQLSDYREDEDWIAYT